jgi:hypothetical protein
VNLANKTWEMLTYKNERALSFEMFTKKLTKALQYFDNAGRPKHDDDVIDWIWSHVQNSKLTQLISGLKVGQSFQVRTSRQILQEIAKEIPNLVKGTNFQPRISQIGQVGFTFEGEAPSSGAHTSDGKLFCGTYLPNRWFHNDMKAFRQEITGIRSNNLEWTGGWRGGNRNGKGGGKGGAFGTGGKKQPPLNYHSISSIASISNTTKYANAGFMSTVEVDSHADTFVAGKNCVPIGVTERSCNVQPYSDEYARMRNVPVVTAATGYTSGTGMNYILVFPEALYIPTLQHSLFNPNQLCHFGMLVQDNPFSDEPMFICTANAEFTACLQSKGTDIFLKTWALSESNFKSYPHIVLCLSQPWNPHSVRLPGISELEREDIEMRNVQAVLVADREIETRNYVREDVIYGIQSFRRRVASSARITYQDLERRAGRQRIQAVLREGLPPTIPGPLNEHDIQAPHTFLSSERHSRTTPEELSERWGLSIVQATLTLKATTRKLVRSALMPLARRYRVDRMFQPNRLQGTFATDTMDLRCTAIHGKRYCQVFANKEFFTACYVIEKKSDAHEPIDHFVRNFGAMDELISDGAPEQVGKHSKFQEKLCKYDTKHKTPERERPNQNPAEGVIREVRKRWYRYVFRTNCPRQLWNYGIPHVCAIMRMTASFAGRLQGRTPIEQLMGETPDISEYLDFGL